MNDILPGETAVWQWLEDAFRETVGACGYREIRFPLLEQTRLFKRSIGAATDIVEKEMYSFEDGGDHVSLRPEGTAGCVRAAEQHGLLYNRQQRLWYQGPMFRRERPQQGRYRQFHQFGLEAFGMAGPDIDAEIIEISAAFWRRLGLGKGCLALELNNIGSAEDRARYGAILGEYLAARAERLDPSARGRIAANPFRVLDSKHPGNQAVIREAPSMADHMGSASVAHYEALKELLAAAGIDFIENPSLVRGLDYYNYCVYEWTTNALGAQGAVCGGGRYDGLAARLGGKPTPAAGFAIGVERLALLLETLGKIPAAARFRVDVCVIAIGEGIVADSQALARGLREQYPGLRVVCQYGGGKYSRQVKRAFELDARLVAVLERSDEGAPRQVKLRSLDDSFEALVAPLDRCGREVGRLLGIP